jgi:hypothetical protein
MRILILIAATVLALTNEVTLAGDGDSLADAFMAQCVHSQACGSEEMRSRGMDAEMLQMIEARMEGQCEAQLGQLNQIESQANSGPNAEKLELMKRCFLAMADMSCSELLDDPEIPECLNV